MTGRDLIMYILQNNLENEDAVEVLRVLDLITVDQAAVKFKVSSATIRTWIDLNWIPTVKIGDKVYIPNTARPKDLALY